MADKVETALSNIINDDKVYVTTKKWIEACSVEELKDGRPLSLEFDDVLIAVVKINDEYFAIDDVCPHQGGQLSLGDIEDLTFPPTKCDFDWCSNQTTQDTDTHSLDQQTSKMTKPAIVCPLHGWSFFLHNGQSNEVDSLKQQTFKTRVKDGKVFVEVVEKVVDDF